MRTAADKKLEKDAGLPDRGNGPSLEENVGAGLGMLAGAVVGTIGGPIGMAVGASIGGVIGDVAGHALHDLDSATSKRDHELDDAIGVTSGPIGAGAPISFIEPARAVTFLRADHDLLGRHAERLLDAVVKGDRAECSEAISIVQASILAHLTDEEREVLPGYAAFAPEDAAAIARDHADIRKALADLDVSTDLHLIREEAVKGLLEKLRAHAERENRTLYPWAQAKTNPT